MMNILIISSSSRINSESSRIAGIICKELTQKYDDKVSIIDFSKIDMPFWHESIWENQWCFQDEWNAILEQLKSADAFIFVVPEWSGMAPPQLKNFFLCTNLELAHKPALIVSISSGMGGSYPISELRMSSFKNTHILWLPDHVIIRKCNAFDLDAKDYQFEQKRLDYCLSELRVYAQRLQGICEDLEKIGLKDNRYGM